MLTRDEAQAVFSGPIASICTPFCRDGSIDYPSLRGAIDFVIAAGGKAVVLTAGDSHYMVLSDREVGEITRAVAEHVAGRATVVAADRQWATAQEVEFAKYARSLGADTLMVMPPDWADSCTPRTMAEHYAAVAEHLPVTVVTNVFAKRPVEFALETLQTLCDISDGLVAIKDDLGGELGCRLGQAFRGRAAMFTSGTKHDYLAGAVCGYRGYLSNFLMLLPEVAWNFWRAAQRGDLTLARQIAGSCEDPFYRLIRGFAGGPDAGIHGALELFGRAQRWRRKPYYSLNESEMGQLAALFASLPPGGEGRTAPGPMTKADESA